MKAILKKVDRVKDINEAIQLEKLEVDFIGISLIDDPRFTDDRKVSEATALSIRNVLKKSALVGEIALDSDWEQILPLIKKIGFDYIQVWGNQIIPWEFQQELSRLNIGIIYSNIEASYEDDPAWILSDANDLQIINNTFFQIDFLGDMENSWNYLKQEAPNYPDDELQIQDINHLAEQYPLFITLDYTPDNVLEIINQLSEINGITMTIAESSQRNDLHYFNYVAILDILSKLKQEKILLSK
jgi:hypothetical protein